MTTPKQSDPSPESHPERQHSPTRPGSTAIVGMKAVAARAGVAVSSVSRVLANHPNVSDAMRRRVLDAVAELGYERDLLAQGLRKGSTTTIGFLVSDISNPLFAEIALAAEQRLREAGHAVLIANSLGTTAGDSEQLRLLQQRRVDGFILSLSAESDEATIAQLLQLRRPFVLLDRDVPEVDASAVLSGHASAVDDAVEHLAGLGHTRIGFIGGSPDVRPTRERVKALIEACARRDRLRAYTDCVAYSAEHGFSATQRMLERKDPPTTIIVGGNQILGGVLAAVRARRLRVPRDLSLVTCDDVPLAEFLDPPIATLTRDPGQIGREAAELLLDALQGAPPSTAVLPVQFAARRSCGPAPTVGSQQG